MKKQLTKEEQLINLFIQKYKNSDTNTISVNIDDVHYLNISEQEASRTIHLLQEEDFLKIKRKSIHNNFNMSWTIALMPLCVYYFDNKKSNKRAKIINFLKEFRAWITLCIAILSFILAV